MASNYGCDYPGCDAHPSKGDAILRTSPKGGEFRGRCAKHLDTREQREELAEDVFYVNEYMKRMN